MPPEGFALPFDGIGLPFEGIGMPFDGIGLPFEGIGLPLEGIGLPHEGIAMPFEGIGLPLEGFALPFDGIGLPLEGIGLPFEGIGMPSARLPPRPAAFPHVFDRMEPEAEGLDCPSGRMVSRIGKRFILNYIVSYITNSDDRRPLGCGAEPPTGGTSIIIFNQ